MTSQSYAGIVYRSCERARERKREQTDRKSIQRIQREAKSPREERHTRDDVENRKVSYSEKYIFLLYK